MNRRFGKARNQKHSYPKKENEQQTIKWTEKYSVYIQAISTIVTLFLFWQVIRQNKFAEKSIALADSSAIQAKRSADAAQRSVDYADSAFRLAKESFISSDSASKLSYNLSATSLKTQITSFNESQKQYETLNRPFVQTTLHRIDSFNIGKPVQMSFAIRNFGKFPANITSYSATLLLEYPQKEKFIGNIADTLIPKRITNVSVSGDNMLAIITSTNVILTEFGYKEIMQGRAFIYLIGKINYVSFGTPKRYENRFLFRITTYPRLSVDAITNTDQIF